MKKTFMSIFRCALGLRRRRLPQFSFVARFLGRGDSPAASRARRRRFVLKLIRELGNGVTHLPKNIFDRNKRVPPVRSIGRRSALQRFEVRRSADPR